MSYTLKTNIANKKNYGNERTTSKIKYIVIHYTGNDGDTDEANTNYFKNNIVNASAHYFVDDDSVTQSVHDNFVAWHCGGARYNNYKSTGGAKYYGECTNTNSLGIELCDTNRNGKYGFSDKTLEKAIELVKDKMEQYNVTIDRVIRHFDVTGKVCPKPFVDDEKAWKEFKNKLTATNTATNTATKSIDELARDVINGKYGNGDARKKALGNLYNEVQKRVNEILTGKTTTPKKSINEIAKEVIQGKWGNGTDRKNRLTKAGYNYNEVQKKVNSLLK